MWNSVYRRIQIANPKEADPLDDSDDADWDWGPLDFCYEEDHEDEDLGEGEADGDDDNMPADVDINAYDYPFENIVFEGGGTKGLAYCGAIQVLEELGIIPNIRRIAGTSAGAITAAFLTVGYSAAEIRELMDVDMNALLNDHSYGYMSFLPNILRHFGWNPATRFLDWFGLKLTDKGLNPDITFNQVYKKYRKELCIVVTNVNRMTAQYFHPKTTPNVPIRVAVRASMAIPVFFQPLRHDFLGRGKEDTFVDGGLLCNYPISCFDGWWLSMKEEDSFLRRLTLKELPHMFENRIRFNEYNNKTLGFMVYAEKERKMLDGSIARNGPSTIPDTKLGREYIEKVKMRKEKQARLRGDRENLIKAIQEFLDELAFPENKENSSIAKEKLERALEQEGFKEHKELIFGKDVTAEDIMKKLDVDEDGKVWFCDLVPYLEGFSMSSKFLGYRRNNVTGFYSFLDALKSTLLYNVQRLFVEEADVKRTVAINTGYIGALDLKLENEDKEYLIQQGRKSTERSARVYVKENKPPLKKGAAKEF